MPASEEFYRDQRRLNLVFLFSSLAMVGATLWMLASDHLLKWKDYQREFNVVKREQLTDALVQQQQAIDEAKLRDIVEREQKARGIRADQDAQLKELEGQLAALRPKLVSQTTQVAFQKANLAEAVSKYDLKVKELEELDEKASASRRSRIEKELADAKAKTTALEEGIKNESRTLEEIEQEAKMVEAKIADMNAGIETAERERKELTSERDKTQRAIDATAYGLRQKVRALPIIDGFASPVKVQQVALEGLPLDYNFKMVTRYDRCMTCHLGIEQAGYTKEKGVVEPFCAHPHLDLYVGANSPHPVEKFGCTSCHQGQGTATSFDWASHTPADREQRADWTKEYGWFFNHFHEQPMFPKRFVESSCLKCHHNPYQIPQAKKLMLGYQTIQTNGCYGCHEINGYNEEGKSIGINLRIAQKNDSEFARSRATRKVGPNLARVSEKLTPEFVRKWIRDPQAFRPTSKMPNYFYYLDEGGEEEYGEGPDGEFDNPHSATDLANTEIHAITHYLFNKSRETLADPKTPKLPTVTAKGDVARGKGLFETKGCVACHNHKETTSLKPKNFGPDLSEVSAKFAGNEQFAWLVGWIQNPAVYHSLSYMPNLQLNEQESVDIATYLRSVPGKWVKDVAVPDLDPVALRDLVLSLESKGKSRIDAEKRVAAMSQDEQLMNLGEKTISRLGCFGCHNIPGFDSAKPIGVPLADWGRKDQNKLAFENVIAKVEKHMHDPHLSEEDRANDFYVKNDYFLDAMHAHQREGFLMQKLRDPRSYDYKKIRRWEDRARMPRFNFTDEQREAVATVILGLVGEQTMDEAYVYSPSVEKTAQYQGRELLDKYNCVGCHIVKPGEYRFTPSEDEANSLITLAKKELDADYSFPGHSAWSVAKPNPGSVMIARGLPDGAENPEEAENPDDPKSFVRLWEATSLRNQTIPSGTKIAIPRSQYTPANSVEPEGGDYAEWLVAYFMSKSADPNNPAERDKAWQKSPPPLLREGEKVQTPWLYRFLLDPEPIRPSVALRMPKFNYRTGDPQVIVNYFAAESGVPFPYAEVPERDSSYLAMQNQAHPDYLKSAWGLITNKDLCVKCHPVAGYTPTGKPEELGPMLRRAPERLRPEWMIRWIANPKRLLPYTGMPVNFPMDKAQFQDIFKGASPEQAKAVRDALINYNVVVDDLAPRQKQEAAGTAAATTEKKEESKK